MKEVLAFVARMILILLIDLPWLTITQPYVATMVRGIQGGKDATLRIGPAILVYAALAYLATIPTSATSAFLMGASVYGVYDMTNLATLVNYDWRFAIADTMWGGVIFTAVYYAERALGIL
jgi:uncharacterized membrane protein